MATPISIVIIAQNEDKVLSNTLSKLVWASEIILVDSGSTDTTIEIAEYYKAKVYYRKFDDYSSQKQFAVNQAKNNWVLNLDADEVLDDELIENLKKFSPDNNIDAYKLNFKHIFMNKVFKFGNESNRKIIRLFDKTKVKYDGNKVHENLIVNTKIIDLKGNVLHYSYLNVNQYLEKLNKYTSLYAQQKFEEGKKFNLVAVLLKTKFEFFKKILLEKNFLNGKEGFYWSVFSAFYMFTKCVKTNELYKNQSNNS